MVHFKCYTFENYHYHYYVNNKIHVQTNTGSVQCLCIHTKHNKVYITQVNEQFT